MKATPETKARREALGLRRRELELDKRRLVRSWIIDGLPADGDKRIARITLEQAVINRELGICDYKTHTAIADKRGVVPQLRDPNRPREPGEEMDEPKGPKTYEPRTDPNLAYR